METHTLAFQRDSDERARHEVGPAEKLGRATRWLTAMLVTNIRILIARTDFNARCATLGYLFFSDKLVDEVGRVGKRQMGHWGGAPGMREGDWKCLDIVSPLRVVDDRRRTVS